MGELVVKGFPHDNIPTEGRYALLPRLLGRATVTLTVKRKSKKGEIVELGDVAIVADGFAAPLTAGNFVDLCQRGFYDGLPVVMMKKRLLASAASSSGPATIETVPILGSYKEGFYDPITAKPRHLPLEIMTIDNRRSINGRSRNMATIDYPEEYIRSSRLSSFSDTRRAANARQQQQPSSTTATAITDDAATTTSTTNTRSTVLNFENTPGLIAMNHPDFLPHRASSEFFILPKKTTVATTTKNNGDGSRKTTARLLNGNYAPFGYIVEGLDVMQQLKPGSDYISQAVVDEFGLGCLVKLREASFTSVMKNVDSNSGGGGSSRDEVVGGDKAR